MKKVLYIVFAVIAVAALAFGVINFVQAQKIRANAGNYAAWSDFRGGMMGGQAFDSFDGRMDRRMDARSGGMMGNRSGDRFGGMIGGSDRRGLNNGRGQMQEYMLTALAEKLGMTTDELNTALDDGQTLLDVAADKGLTVAEFQTMQEEAHILAVDKALADGVISQNQADWMKERFTTTEDSAQ